MAHGVGSDHADMIVFLRLLGAHASDFFADEVDQLIPDLHAKDEFVGEKRGQCEEESSVSAANIDNRYIFPFETVVSGLFVEGRVLDGVAGGLETVLLGATKVEGEVCFPIDVGMMRRVGIRCGVERIDMCSHPVIFFLG
jgi:hypothetical protein